MAELDDVISNDVGLDVDNLLGDDGITNDVQQDVSDPNVYVLTLERPAFSKFTSSLSVIQDVCIDCDIKNGLIRSKSNDRKNVIVIDLTSVIGRKNLSMSQLKMKLSLLKTFDLDMGNVQGADNTIIIEATENDFLFSDCFSKLMMRKPIESYLENRYIEDNDFESIILDNCKEDNLLFTQSIDNYLRNRICQICNTFRCDSVCFEFHGNYCKLSTETKSKDNISKLVQQITLYNNVDQKKCSLNNIPFVLNVQSGLNISCYKVGETACMFKSSLVYFGIPITIYSKAKLQDFE